MNNLSLAGVIAKKELIDALRSRVFITFFGFLLFLTLVSVLVGSLDFQVKLHTYQTALEQLAQTGQSYTSLTPPEFFPLQLLRGPIEYLEIIGSILAIVMGYLSISKERGSNSLQLIFTRPIKKITFFLGKLAGNAILLAGVSLLLFLGMYLSITLIGGTSLTSLETTKLILSYLFTCLYLISFFSLSAFMSLVLKSLPNALILTFLVWLMVVLIIPQIGDTMDTDNQVPGGFFASMQMTRAQEKEVLLQFTGYENARNFSEETSLTKHYERLTFALLGIKTTYNQKNLREIFTDKTGDALWLVLSGVLLSTLAAIAFSRKQYLWKQYL